MLLLVICIVARDNSYGNRYNWAGTVHTSTRGRLFICLLVSIPTTYTYGEKYVEYYIG